MLLTFPRTKEDPQVFNQQNGCEDGSRLDYCNSLLYHKKPYIGRLHRFQNFLCHTVCKIQSCDALPTQTKGPRWQSGNTLASHLCGRGSIPVMAVSGKAGSCLPLVGSLQYRTLANYMYWFPLPFQLPVVI